MALLTPSLLVVWLIFGLLVGVVVAPGPVATAAKVMAIRWVVHAHAHHPTGVPWGTWEWIDETRRRRSPPPNVQQIVSASLKMHGQVQVSKALGLSRQTCLAVGGGFCTLGITIAAAGMRVGELAHLSEELGEP